MFTGLIEQQGEVLANISNQSANRLIISSSFDQLVTGESIAVNGVCLTLLPMQIPGQLHFDISPETLRLTTLADVTTKILVNLERAMFGAARFGGHYVSGHVDTMAHVSAIQKIDECMEVELSGFNAQEMLYLIPKGSITVDGVSLTINQAINQTVKLMLIPHTLQRTTFRWLHVGQKVNIEFDYLTRIVAHQLQITGKLNCEVKP